MWAREKGLCKNGDFRDSKKAGRRGNGREEKRCPSKDKGRAEKRRPSRELWGTPAVS